MASDTLDFGSLDMPAKTPSMDMAEAALVRELIKALREPEDVVKVWLVLEESEQQRVLSYCFACLDEPDMFLEAGDLLTIIIPHITSRKLKEWAVSILRYIREETRYTETRKTVLGILWDTGLL
ncbi:uncharacterized protein AMSG_00390 [Thecamonas trahens ATCC 50062]|uniref:Uncharacterized protein n=1 Tax=Thecamonas trahens ATCC 50062 TaxID=461836 RepID=A0A0L0DBE8_THETB|nr:hypothetical protein AMSG_00390 [Thecamonas trahens ATCC 50062]KNC48613.1 hypothetical protein AMSG_00390 [Thecamonas trahens ATCC 50062]|eukprot:XP_013762669.1 hypothetical protein AMSG_00390 [Thecamonas trahens ATCC 50062]